MVITMSRTRFRLALALLLSLPPLLGVGATPAAWAADRDDDDQLDAATQDLVNQGIALRREGKDQAALGLFLDAEKRVPRSVRVLLHVTTAAQAAGKWMMAYQYLQKASTYRNDPYFQKYRAAIRSVEEVIAQHVGQFRVVGSPNGAEVFLNGQLVGSLPMEAPAVVEVGSYELTVTRSGFFPLRRPVNVAGGGGLSQEAVDLKPADRISDQLAAIGPSAFLVQAERPDGDRQRSGPRWITWTLAASSVVLLGSSAVAFGIRERNARRWNDDALCLDDADVTATRQEICGGWRSAA
jgi:hypothetical protein